MSFSQERAIIELGPHSFRGLCRCSKLTEQTLKKAEIASWQSALAPGLQIYFLSFPKVLTALTTFVREGRGEKEGTGVKWASHYITNIIYIFY